MSKSEPKSAVSIETFTALPTQHQRLLQLLSIIYLPIASTPLAQCAARAELKDPQTQSQWTNRSIKQTLSALAKQGWVMIDSNRFSLPPSLVEDVTLQSLKDKTYSQLAHTIRAVFKPRQAYSGKQVWTSWEAAVADARMYLYLGDYLTLKNVLADIHSQFQYIRQHTGGAYPLPDILGVTPQRQQLAILSPEIFIHVVAPFYTSYAAFRLDDIDDFWAEMLHRKATETDETLRDILGTLIAEQCLVRGDHDHFPKKPTHPYYAALWHGNKSCQQLLQGDSDGARQTYDKSIQLLRKATKHRGPLYHKDIFEAFHFLNLLSAGTVESISKTLEAHTALSETFVIYFLLIAYADLLSSGEDSELKEEINLLQEQDDAFILLFSLLIGYWAGLKMDTAWIDKAKTAYQRAHTNGYFWFAAELAEALSRHLPTSNPQQAEYTAHAKRLRQKTGCKTLFNLVNRQHSWERSLNALSLLAKTKEQVVSHERLIWILHEDINEGSWSLHPKVQKKTRSGTWSKGRNVSLSRLLRNQDDMPYLSSEDLQICMSAIVENTTYGFYGREYELDINLAWPLLVNHPRVYWDKTRSTPLEILQGDIELLVTEEGDEIRITIYPEIKKYQIENQDYIVTRETPTRLRIYRLDAQHEQIVNIIGNGLLLPKEAEAQLRETLMTLAPMMRIQSDIAGVDNAREIDSDPMIHVHLLPYGDGLRLSLRVQPFGDGHGPIYPPGHGRKNLLIEIEGEKVKVRRDLEQEVAAAEQLQEQVEILADWTDLEQEIVLEEPDEALEALTSLHAIGDKISLEWPEGEFMRVTSTLGAKNMRLNINEKGEWFEIEGEISVNEDLVLSLGQLLELSQQHKSRFLKMSDGQYVALSKNLQKKLQALNAYADNDKETTRISGLAGLALEDFLTEVESLEGDGKWQQHIQQLKTLQDKHYKVPATLQAELRDYQIEGFHWLARLADWGVGACLADDMGLGKTLQSLALILTRAQQGPTLVVAPVSVCNNWLSETQRFAPTLKPVFYRGKKRQDILKSLQPYDLVICSYGLLPQDADLIAEVQWTTALLDEAQAIKNIGTKRTKAAWNIQADFKMITTGTPIENHLGELWSLFRYLNPGLLGSQDHFTRLFMAPIERFKDKNASYNLKRLIQPFILRRLKTDVLQELPPRTEMTLSVPLSKEERALYEAVRQKALKKFSAAHSTGTDTGTADGETGNHIQILAEITKLRLASCHPRLVMENSPLPGSKLQAFGEILEELLENNHKALVFSQFVKHLSILRDYLDEQGIHYQYLDGSTPQSKRKQAVDAFQKGEGDVFLISLKAGGSGLNLTAADYVIHMDPWWNPAVEDQASDRAHRIGQQRPVTIYRLVAENTIEEKIVKLHERKRALADNLLEGSDMSGKMSADDMLRLIRDA